MWKSMCARGLALALLLGGSIGCDAATLDVKSSDVPAARADDIHHYIAVDGDGLWIRAINLEVTPCVDGAAEACAMEALDFTRAGLDPAEAELAEVAFRAGEAVAVGWMERASGDDGESGPTLRVTEVWMSEVPKPLTMTAYSVVALDIMCVRAPCPEYEALTANVETGVYVHYVDLEASGASEAGLERGYAALERAELLIAGKIVHLGPNPNIGVPLDGRWLIADTFYTRFP